MHNPGELLPLPESETNKPNDLKPGWKSWDDTRKRWWSGTQWTESYLKDPADEFFNGTQPNKEDSNG